MNKEKVIAWLDDLIEQASQSDKYFKERNDLYIENQQLKDRIDKAISLINRKSFRDYNNFPNAFALGISSTNELLEILKSDKC